MRCTCLIPALNRRSNRIQDDCEVELLWVPPTVCHLVTQNLAFVFVELWNILEIVRALCYQSTLPKKRQNVRELVLVCIVFDILEKLIPGNANKGILDPMYISSE